jgi:3-mercaptopyruvate sulfurtransferase SseA
MPRRAAISLRHKGITRVWVLEGGLKAWEQLNLPTTLKLGDAAQTAVRFGIQVEGRKRKSDELPAARPR